MYEKVGESTEVALKVLAEKLNVQGLDRDTMSNEEKATACHLDVYSQYRKVCVSVAGIPLLNDVCSNFCLRRISLWSFLVTASP